MKGSCILKVLTICMLRLIISLFIIRNYEYPDEYWQAPEIAHHIKYGYGYRTWQWTIDDPIRNPVYPWILSLSYSLIPEQYSIYAPKIIHAFLCSICDYYLWYLMLFFYPHLTFQQKGLKKWYPILFLFGGSFGYTIMLNRTYFNSFQCILQVIAFYYWLQHYYKLSLIHKSLISSDRISRILVIIGYVSRPTSIIFWAIIWPYQLFTIFMARKDNSLIQSVRYILKNLFTLISMLLCSLAIGTIYNQKLVLTEANFFKYNFIEKWANFYGQEPFYFYFFISLPLLLGGILVLYILAMYKMFFSRQFTIQPLNKSQQIYYFYYDTEFQEERIGPPIKHPIRYRQLKIFSIFCLIYLLISSFSTHKEHRFILPIIPFILIISYLPIILLQTQKQTNIINKYSILKLILLVNIFLIISLAFYGKNSEPIFNQIKIKIPQDYKHNNQTNQKLSIMYLAEGHSIPGLAYLHRDVDLIIPDSSPPAKISGNDQNQWLQSNPINLIKELTNKYQNMPKWIIVEGKYFTSEIQIFLKKYHYQQLKKERYCTIFQSLFISYDQLILFEKNTKSSLNMDMGKKIKTDKKKSKIV